MSYIMIMMDARDITKLSKRKPLHHFFSGLETEELARELALPPKLQNG